MLSDSATSLLVSAAALWSAERAAFRDYQHTFCDDCAMFEESASEFFRSSSALVERVVERFPSSAAAACAEGMMHFRLASRGEGKLDDASVDRASSSFRRALALEPPPALEQRVRAELADLASMRPRR